MEVSVV
jgi:2-(3-amino-3-carboxypropyl)histidine synthase